MQGQQNVLIRRHMVKVHFRYIQYSNNGRVNILFFFSILSHLVYFLLFHIYIYIYIYMECL